MASLRYLSKRLFHKTLIKDVHNITVINVRLLNYASKEYTDEKDPAKYFFNKETQSLLKTLTRIDLDVVFRRRKTGERLLSIPTQKFLTQDQLDEAMEQAQTKIDELLQIPPVLKIRKPIETVLSRDPALKGLDDSKFVFTDITFGIRNFDRMIVVREPDGTLRDADWDTRERMHQIYFPLPGRRYKVPKMFEEPYLESLLNRKEYLFILDRTCLQFEPDSSEYQKLTSITYQYINDNSDFDSLRSTRHFGSLCFFLVWHKMIDNLLLDLIKSENIQEANALLKLYCKIHDVKLEFTMDADNIKGVEEYIQKYSPKKAQLELAVAAYKELERERIDLEKGVRKAHGVA